MTAKEWISFNKEVLKDNAYIVKVFGQRSFNKNCKEITMEINTIDTIEKYFGNLEVVSIRTTTIKGELGEYPHIELVLWPPADER